MTIISTLRERFYTLRFYIQKLGLKTGLHVFLLNTKQPGENQIQTKETAHPFYIRGATSDFEVFKQIFLEREYDLRLKEVPKVIVDCGANIGLAAVYFKNKFPAARIISVEPEQSNFDLLKKNTATYSNVECLKAGIWKRDSFLEVKPGPTKANWDFVVNEVTVESANTIKGVSIQGIMNTYNLSEIDLLKIDIEGAEKELFESNYEGWIPKTKVIVIELHDRMKPGSGQSFFRAISQYDFDFSHKGENIIATRR